MYCPRRRSSPRARDCALCCNRYCHSLMSMACAGSESLSTMSWSSPLSTQAQRHFVNREFLVGLFDDGLLFDVCRNRAILSVFSRPRSRSVRTIKMSGLNTDLPELSDAVLGGLGLGLTGRFQKGNQRQMDEQANSAARCRAESAGSLSRNGKPSMSHPPSPPSSVITTSTSGPPACGSTT